MEQDGGANIVSDTPAGVSKAQRLDESDAGLFDKPGQDRFSSDEDGEAGDKHQ